MFVPYSAHASGKNYLTKDIEGVDRVVELEEKSTAAAEKQVKLQICCVLLHRVRPNYLFFCWHLAAQCLYYSPAHRGSSATQTRSQPIVQVNDSQFPPVAKHTRSRSPEALLWPLIRTTNDVSQRVGDELEGSASLSLLQSNQVKKCSRRDAEWKDIWGGGNVCVVSS